MTPAKTLRLGTRGSALALWQANHISRTIGERFGVECLIEVIKTAGDRIQDVAFRKMEGKGFFTQELQEALLDGRVDLVVHSLKDLPTDSPKDLEVVAIPERANSADLLLARPGLIDLDGDDPLHLPDGAVLGTSSLRRAAQTLAQSPNITIKALRGNVPTRLKKLQDGQYDAIILAAAGVERLNLDLGTIESVVLHPEIMLPAPGQGALAIECRIDDPATRILLELHDHSVARCVGAERGLLSLLGGGCHLPLGCLATEDENSLRLQAILGDIDDDATRATVARVGAAAQDPDTAARVCFEALKMAMPGVVVA